jgi:hypothetical protein
MTPTELRALAEALRPMAAAPCFDGIDIDRAADYLRACADAVPVAWLLRSKTRRNTDGDLFIRGCYGTPRTKQDYEFAELDGDEYIELVARPAPAAPQAEQKREPTETMTLQDVWEAAGGNPGIKPTREEVIEALRQLDEVCDECDEKHRHISEPRPCTCHPDDNPPVPCAQKYALSECRAASGEPKREPLSEKQIDAIHELWYERAGMSFADVVRAVERAHGITGDSDAD